LGAEHIKAHKRSNYFSGKTVSSSTATTGYRNIAYVTPHYKHKHIKWIKLKIFIWSKPFGLSM